MQLIEPVNYPPDWNEIRRFIYRRDGYICQQCGARNVELHAHHIIPLSDGGSNHQSNLVTLCDGCHVRYHPHIHRRDRSIFHNMFQTEILGIIMLIGILGGAILGYFYFESETIGVIVGAILGWFAALVMSAIMIIIQIVRATFNLIIKVVQSISNFITGKNR